MKEDVIAANLANLRQSISELKECIEKQNVTVSKSEQSVKERLKDLRVERGLTLEQLAEQTHLSKSALGSYEAEDFKDISHYALIKLAKFYEVTTDYILGRSKNRNHPNADLADLRLSNDMIELLKSGLIDKSLLCELVVHPNFPPTPAY